MDTRGRHVIAELDGCDPDVLKDIGRIRHILLEAARSANACALASEIFEFQNGGVSGFVLLAESHISIHTWPEHLYAAVDIYTCGQHTLPDNACAFLAERLGASSARLSAFERGLLTAGGRHEHRSSPARSFVGSSLQTCSVPTSL